MKKELFLAKALIYDNTYYCCVGVLDKNIVFSEFYDISYTGVNSSFSFTENLSNFSEEEMFQKELEINFDMYLLKELQQKILSDTNKFNTFIITVEY